MESRSPEWVIENCKIYLHDCDVIPVEIKNKKDLIAFYPYIISMLYMYDGKNIVHLSKNSYIDEEEADVIGWRLNTLKKYWRKCKRNKKQFNKDDAWKNLRWFDDDQPEPYEIELINRVAEFGNKATMENLHNEMHDRMREKWFNLMVDSGWDKSIAYRWVYGWKRWAEWIESNEENNIK